MGWQTRNLAITLELSATVMLSLYDILDEKSNLFLTQLTQLAGNLYPKAKALGNLTPEVP